MKVYRVWGITMKVNRLFVLALLFSVSVCPGLAQQSARLQFQVVKNGSIVARPEVVASVGAASSMAIDGVGLFEFTPTVRGSDLAIAFEIRSAGKQLRPSLVITRNEPGNLSWRSTTGAQSFKLTVSWIP